MKFPKNLNPINILGQLPQIPNPLVPTIASTLAPSTHDSSSTSKGGKKQKMSINIVGQRDGTEAS